MKTAGIICEYNPFHLGHARQLRLIREQLGKDCRIVCAMSGNYVQRGMPAMWDRSTRAAAALACGADLVLELPITGVLQSAEGFARTGVEIFSRLGCVDHLSFGAECGSAEPLMEMARATDSPAFAQALRTALDQGLPYAAARQAALQDPQNLLHSPNNILGLEYCRAILHLNSSIKPLAVHRGGDYHAAEADREEPSATAIRGLFPNGPWQDFIPTEAAHVLTNAPWYDLSWGERAVLGRLRALTEEEWETCAHGSEGLWSKAMKASRSEATWDAIVETIKSKRYPRTRIQRLLLCAYLGISERALKQPVPYIRILASNPVGRELVRQARKNDGLVLVNPGQTPPDPDYYRMECRAADLFTLFAAPGHSPVCRLEQNSRILLSNQQTVL